MEYRIPTGTGHRRRTRAVAVAIALVLFLPLAGEGVARAGTYGGIDTTPPATDPAPPPASPFPMAVGEATPPAPAPPLPLPPPPAVPLPEEGYWEAIGRAMDVAHARMERGILAQTVRFDTFFGEAKGEPRREERYELRWRNSLRVERGGNLKFGSGARASFVLSRISERLRLFIAGEDEPTPTTQTLPKDPGNPGFDRTTPTTHFANTELRYELIRKPALNLFLGAGVRIALPFEAFVRSRFQYTHNLSDIALMRFAETFFLKNTDLLGETSEISFERLLARGTILRWASAATASQEISGVEWGSELSLLRELSPKSAITLTGGVYGNTTTAGLADNFRLFALYRRNFLRPWLFYELEPEISWPRDPTGYYPADIACTFRLEIVFQGIAPRMEKIAARRP